LILQPIRVSIERITPQEIPMSAVAAPVTRRTLRFETFDQYLAEAERCAAVPHRLAGRWSYGQILTHLAQAIDCFYDGFGFQAPWFARALIAPLVKNRVLTKGMSPGFNLPKTAKALQPSADISVADGLTHLRTALDRLNRQDPSHPHPFFGRMTPDEVRQLMLRHAELHLSFVVPE
jgi:hypothetical protein